MIDPSMIIDPSLFVEPLISEILPMLLPATSKEETTTHLHDFDACPASALTLGTRCFAAFQQHQQHAAFVHAPDVETNFSRRGWMQSSTTWSGGSGCGSMATRRRPFMTHAPCASAPQGFNFPTVMSNSQQARNFSTTPRTLGTRPKTPYSTLGIRSTATLNEIKLAYKIKAMQYHPDTNNSSNASEKFKEISTAYSKINTAKKRQKLCCRHHSGGSWSNCESEQCRRTESQYDQRCNTHSHCCYGNSSSSRTREEMRPLWETFEEMMICIFVHSAAILVWYGALLLLWRPFYKMHKTDPALVVIIAGYSYMTVFFILFGL